MGKYWFKYGVNGYVREIVVDAIGESAAWRIVENMYPNDRVRYLSSARADKPYGQDKIMYERKKMNQYKY
jgi:hypothetical protein